MRIYIVGFFDSESSHFAFQDYDDACAYLWHCYCLRYEDTIPELLTDERKEHVFTVGYLEEFGYVDDLYLLNHAEAAEYIAD